MYDYTEFDRAQDKVDDTINQIVSTIIDDCECGRNVWSWTGDVENGFPVIVCAECGDYAIIPGKYGNVK